MPASQPPAPQNGTPSSGASRYLVAARKYRPALFNELVAQEHVTETLKNALRLDRLAHAYLFSGPRGVGKTTAARILAKAINCTTPLDERDASAEPCRTCDSCRSFEEGRSLNIIEIDAASNNKVDDIRELRETVRIPPQGSKKKVYIIDEVHMLSNAAFNALLKTLEEPPPHALFIFATTEPHKVLPTILSRCQRFDFRRIPVPAMVERLREICREESIQADEESLMLLARKGDGALRDALSAFDQAVSLCGTDIQYADLAQALGVVDIDLFFRLTGHASAGSSAGMLHLVEEVVRTGYDLLEFLGGLAEHLRNLLVARTTESTDLIEAAEATRARYAEAARPLAEADLLRLLMVVSDAEDAVKQSAQPRLKLEMALLQMAHLPHAADLDAARRKLDRLDAMAREGTLPDASALAAAPSEAPSSPGDAGGAGADRANPGETRSGETASAAAPPPGASPAASSSERPSSPEGSAESSPETESTAAEDAGPPAEDAGSSLPQPGAPSGDESLAAVTSAARAPASDATQAAQHESSSQPAPSEATEAPESASSASATPSAEVTPSAEAAPATEDESATEAEPAAKAETDEREPAAQDASSERDAFSEEAPSSNDDPPEDRSAPPASAAPAAESSAAAASAPDEQAGYRDLFGRPALQRRSADGAPEPADAGASDDDASATGDAGDAAQALAAAPPSPGEEAEGIVQRLSEQWETFIQSVRKTSGMRLASCLRHATPVAASGGTVTVAVPDHYHRDTLNGEDSLLIEHLPDVLREPASRFRFIVENTLEASDSRETASETSPYEVLSRMREEHPVVKALFDSFGGEPVH